MTVDPVPSHFELFDLPQSFVVDQGQLESRYRELQRSLHPDRFVNAGDLERRLSVQQATQVNEAYRIGVNGVPCFMIDQTFAVMGAHPPEIIAEAIQQAVGQRADSEA